MNDLVATGSIHSFDPMRRHGQASAEHVTFLSENFSYIPSNCSIARPESPPEFIRVPIFRSKVPVANDGPELVEVILHGIMEIIQREFQMLRVQEAVRNSTAVTLESAMAMLGCKRSKVFTLLKQGLLERAPKVGRSIMVTVASIEALIAEGLPQKTRRWSCRFGQQPAPAKMKARNRRKEKSTSGAAHDPGSAIRNLTI